MEGEVRGGGEKQGAENQGTGRGKPRKEKIVLWNFERGGNREFTRTIAGSDNDPYSGGDGSACVDRGDVCRVAGPAWTVQRDSSGQANADEAGSMTRRQMVSRPVRRNRPSVGNATGCQQ